MDLALNTLHQVLIMAIMILVGYICAKRKVLQAEARTHFSNLLVQIVVPCMIFSSYLSEFDPAVFRNLLLSFGLSTVLLLVGIVVTMLTTGRFEEKNRPIYRFAGFFSNAGYMGFPLIEALFGAEGLLYASAYNTIFNILLWTLGYGMISGIREPRKVAKTILTSPALIAVALGLVVYIAQIPIPDILARPIDMIGDMNTPISMIITGIIIAQADLGRLLKNRQILGISTIRLLLTPAVCLGIAAILIRLGMPAGMPLQVCLLLEACPCAAITSVFAVQFHYDEEGAAGAVIVSTLLSIVTLPLYALLITALY